MGRWSWTRDWSRSCSLWSPVSVERVTQDRLRRVGLRGCLYEGLRQDRLQAAGFVDVFWLGVGFVWVWRDFSVVLRRPLQVEEYFLRYMPAKERKLTKARCCTVSKTKHKAKQNKACLSGGCHLNQKRKARAHEHDTGNRANKARCSNMQ